MSEKLQKFYKSRKWESFINVLRQERTQADGSIICEHCGKPIVKAYDCIGHHITELTDDNVDDALISLNSKNVMLVHFKCHNAIHKRFGYNVHREQEVYIIYGAPCSGKSTWVKENAESGDIILDIDRLWAAIRAESCTAYEKPNELKQNVFALRDAMLDMIRVRRGRWRKAFIIGGYPLQGERERLAETVGAKQIIFIDTPKDVCIERAKQKSSEWIEYIDTWFERYAPPSE